MKKIKFIIFIYLAIIIAIPSLSSAATSTLRSWEYVGINFNINPNWTFTIMPGHKSELWRDKGQPINTFLLEFFAGPEYRFKTGDFSFSFPLLYYYLGFPSSTSSYYYTNQGFTFSPTVIWKLDRWMLSFRLFTHHLIYSGLYRTESERWGYSLLFTEKLEVSFKITDWMRILIADEVFNGIAADAEAAPTYGAGFYTPIFFKNKLYAGFIFYPSESLFLKLQYIYETSYVNLQLSQVDNYISLVILYNVNFYKNE